MMTSQEPMVRVRAFSKTFYVGLRRKPSYAARDISLEVQPGEIFGFLGPNGAGKTTTIKALLGLIRPDQGELSLLGHAISDPAWRARVGYMPEHPTFYDYLTGHELVTWFARLSGVNRIDAEKEARALLERVGLSQAMNRRLRGYSKGMLQRTGLANCQARSSTSSTRARIRGLARQVSQSPSTVSRVSRETPSTASRTTWTKAGVSAKGRATRFGM